MLQVLVIFHEFQVLRSLQGSLGSLPKYMKYSLDPIHTLYILGKLYTNLYPLT